MRNSGPEVKGITDMSPKSGVIEKAQVLGGLGEDELCEPRIVVHELCETEIREWELGEIKNQREEMEITWGGEGNGAWGLGRERWSGAGESGGVSETPPSLGREPPKPLRPEKNNQGAWAGTALNTREIRFFFLFDTSMLGGFVRPGVIHCLSKSVLIW